MANRAWKRVLLGLGVAVFAGSGVAQEENKKPTVPAVKPAETSIKLLETTLERLRKDLGPDHPSVKELEQTLKQVMAQPRLPAIQAPVPAVPPGNPIPQPPLDPGIPELELEKELLDAQQMMLQQMDMLRQMLNQRGGLGGIQIQGGANGPIVLGLNPAGDAGRKGRFGIRIEAPNEALVAQLDLPNGQGIVCTDVPADSVAGKAGLKPHDVLLEVGGKPVPSNPADFINQLRAIKADEAVDVVLLRKGRKETIKGIKLPADSNPVPLARPGLQLNPLIDIMPRLPAPGIAIPDAVPAPRLPNPGNVPNLQIINGESIQVQQQNSAFTVQMNKDGIKMTITGDKEDGKPMVNSIEVDANGKVIRAESIQQLPKEYQPMAERGLKNVR